MIRQKGLINLDKISCLVFRIKARRKFRSRVRYLDRLYKEKQATRTSPVWTKSHTRRVNNENFRSDNVYVWQKRNYNYSDIMNSYIEVKNLDNRNLLGTLEELGTFGVEVFDYGGKKFSRDLMDSVLEINFLADYLSMPLRRVLDIGAGYGRFASRLLECNFASEVFCIDAIAKSTAISEIYLTNYIKNGKVRIIGTHERAELRKFQFDLAVNVHSFSEMSLSEVESWATLLGKLDVNWLFVVPNGKNLALNNGTDFEGILSENGFEVKIKRDKYFMAGNETRQYYPSTFYLLKKRSA